MTHRSAAALVAAALAFTGCATAPSASTSTSSAPGAPLTVFAAASLRGAFEEIGREHTASTGVGVRFSFEGSATLVDQLAGGAPADVLATADETTMTRAVEEGLIDGSPRVLARNVLTLVVPTDNPANITGLDGSLTGSRLVVCASEVPCGRATQKLAELAGVRLSPVSAATSVSGVLASVTSGEADAGVVYETDARSAGDAVLVVPVENADRVVNSYPIAVTAAAPQADAARAFVDRVEGPDGQAVLARYGFRTP